MLMKYVEPKQNPLLCLYTIFKTSHHSLLSDNYTLSPARVNQKLSEHLLCRLSLILTF